MSITVVTGQPKSGKTNYIVDELRKMLSFSTRAAWYYTPNQDPYPRKDEFAQEDLPADWENGYPAGAVVVFDGSSDILVTEEERIVQSQKLAPVGKGSTDEVHIFISVYDLSELPKKVAEIADRTVYL